MKKKNEMKEKKKIQSFSFAIHIHFVPMLAAVFGICK